MNWAPLKKGFTIVELIIVVVVIAILATITAIGYAGVTNNAKSVVLDVSLRNAADEMKLASLDAEGLYPAALPSTVKAEKDTVLHLASTPEGNKSFCLNAYRISAYEVSSYDSVQNTTRPYLCSGPLEGSPVGGSLPAVPLNTNLVADFSEWTLSGGASYNKTTKELTFSSAPGSALSPLVRFSGASMMALTFDIFSTTAAPTHTPQAGTYTGSSYFAANGTTPALNSIGYAANGNSQAVPLNAWTTRTFSINGGPNVVYARFSIDISPTSYTSGNFKVRNPVIERKP